MSDKIAGLFYEVDYKVNQQGLKRAETGIKQIGDNAKGTVNQIGFLEEGMGSLIGKAAGIVSVGYAFKKTTDLIGQSVVAYTEFDDSLRKTGSKLNLTDVEMKSLANSTRSVALEFNSTGKAVSDAQEYLALAGYNLKEIQAASPTVVAAQRATGESMQLVSDIATDTASSYGYMANELNFVTDRMVYTTTAFNTNFAQMGEAMKYVAPVAKNAGLEFADLNAYIGVAANSGIKASQAGTALRAMFLRIQAPSKMAEKQLKKYNIQLYDNKGKFIGVNNALALMEKKMGTMTEKQKAFFMQQVFGTEAIKKTVKYVSSYANNTDHVSIVELANKGTYKSTLGDFTAQEYTMGIAGVFAGLPLNRSGDNLTLTDLKEVQDVEAALGKLNLYNDDGKVRINMAVNSKTTFDSTWKSDTRFIKVVEGMCIVVDDIRDTFKNYWMGIYLNNYDNKMNFCSNVNKIYFKDLQPNVLSADYDNRIEIDLEKQKQVVVADGKDPDELTELEILRYPSGHQVFLAGDVRFANTMVDLHLVITM
jgi:TP901 family phage tail tape measure protein